MPTEKCPQCGRRGSACRSVPLGYWCQEYGLDEDKSLWIHPEPDPVGVAIDLDADVEAARVNEELASSEFYAADEAWKAALVALATARIRTANNGAYFTTHAGEVPPRRDRKLEEKLREAEVEAREQRERSHVGLVKARQRHGEARQSARLVLTIREQGW